MWISDFVRYMFLIQFTRLKMPKGHSVYRRPNKTESSIKVIREEEDDHSNLSTLKSSTADDFCL